MRASAEAIAVRRTTLDDIDPLRAILDAIIAIGGTTAFEEPLGAGAFDELFVSGPECILCLTAEGAAGEVVGFQALGRNPALPLGWGDIGTFTRRRTGGAPGAGAALFAETRRAARGLGLVAINARIRADNAAGIAYYGKMGFETYRVDPAVPLRDGTPVDRVSKRFRLA